ncbi:MAG: T9SS type A sorting domain-containing protein [Candidatus Coatesbacteria bacterium]|nr:MAG: T9SS type A sorting domain-containing protein [Candidatus Coatesbacteria bacterium]
MDRTSFLNGLIFTLFVITSAGATPGDEAIQTDWSEGPGVTGPVTDWGNTFDNEVYINWYDVPGELKLTRVTTEHVVDDEFEGAQSVYAADVDGDGDVDVLGTSNALNSPFVNWWENLDGSGTSWYEHTVDESFAGLSVYAADVDGDDDMDVLGATSSDNSITWWENANGSGTSWTERTVDGTFNGAYSVYADDVDGDGDMDVLGAAIADGLITWWENVDGSGTSWYEHLIDDDFSDAISVHAADVDDDGDTDVLGASFTNGLITWWENADGSGTSWNERTVSDDYDYAYDVYAADVDDDGDIDILGGGVYDDDIAWWENLDGSGTAWTKHTIDELITGVVSVYADDVDRDGDLDVLSAAYSDDDISWWENLDGSGTSWTQRVVDDNFDHANSVYAADVDGDGDIDALGAAGNEHGIAWWEVTEFASSGELVSSIYDTEGSPKWGQIDWTADTPDGTTVKFRLRASNSWGIMGEWSVDITNHPFELEGFLENGLRYLQYKAILETTDTGISPTLEDVTVEWGYTDIVVTSFTANGVDDGVNVSWECADEVAGFNLYRSKGTGEGKAVASRDTLNSELITGESPYEYLDATVEEDATYSYWLEAIDIGGARETFGPVDCTWNGVLPTTYALYQSRPNPTTGTATIAFDLPEDTKVTLAVYDISGRRTMTLVDETLTAGEHEAEVSRLAPGIYVYKLDAGDFSAARKMVVQ